MILIIDDDSAVRDSLGLMLKVARMDYLAVGDDKAAIGGRALRRRRTGYPRHESS